MAVQWAIADRELRRAAALGDTFRDYLERSGCLRERDSWVGWLRGAVAEDFTEQVAEFERLHALTLSQGDSKKAVAQLQDLIKRLRLTTEFDPALQLALAVRELGQVLVLAGASAQAISVLWEAIGCWSELVEEAGGKPWKELLAMPGSVGATTELAGLAAAMGDLANALTGTGHHDEALGLAGECFRIHEKCGHKREASTAHGQRAQILVAVGRYDEAAALYDRMLAAARATGDKELEGTTLQSQAALACKRNQLKCANRLCQQALRFFQEADDHQGVMQCYNILGIVEWKADRLAEARVWYQKSRELAVQLQDQAGLGQAAQNLGIIWQEVGKAARKGGDESAARCHFEAARRSIEESLRIKQVACSKPFEADALSQLAQIHVLLDDFGGAESYAHQARQIRESLALGEVWKDYNTFSQIAEARGDTSAAAEWARKRDELRAEVDLRAGGGSDLPAEMLRALQSLTIACAQAGSERRALVPAEEEHLTQMEEGSEPFPAFAGFLREVAAGCPTTIPDGLPSELREWLDRLAVAQ